MQLRNDDRALFGIPLVSLLLLVGVGVIFYGLYVIFQNGSLGTGLTVIGIGVILGGIGNFARIKSPYFLVAGGAGFILILVGAAIQLYGK